MDNGDVGSGNGRKRRPPCNGLDRLYLTGNGADFPLVLAREAIGGTDE